MRAAASDETSLLLAGLDGHGRYNWLEQALSRLFDRYTVAGFALKPSLIPISELPALSSGAVALLIADRLHDPRLAAINRELLRRRGVTHRFVCVGRPGPEWEGVADLAVPDLSVYCRLLGPLAFIGRRVRVVSRAVAASFAEDLLR